MDRVKFNAKCKAIRDKHLKKIDAEYAKRNPRPTAIITATVGPRGDQAKAATTADSLVYASILALNHPVELREEVTDRRSTRYKFFVSLCAYLQRGRGKNPIALPVERIGELLGVSPMTVSRYREWGEEDGYLTHTRAAVHGPGKKGRADEYIFDMDRFPHLRANNGGGEKGK